MRLTIYKKYSNPHSNEMTILYFLSLLVLLVNATYASNGISKSWVNNLNRQQWLFTENKGQLTGNIGNQDIKFYGNSGGVYIYCKPGMISFIFANMDEAPAIISEATGKSMLFPTRGISRKQKKNNPGQSIIYTTRADLVLTGSNLNSTITASEQQVYYENFYLAHTGESGITNVHTYKTLTYRGIYKHIDLVLHVRENGMKYEFILQPGGKVKDIQLQWNGINSIALNGSGEISYTLLLGKWNNKNRFDIKETSPVVYQGNTAINSRFSKKGNRISFFVGKYDHSKNLVIDPELSWGTYFGGPEETLAWAIATDAQGNAFIAGSTSNPGIATPGAYQAVYGGDLDSSRGDAFIAKFTHQGKLAWCTYFGGERNDEAKAIALDPSGNVVITGRTLSTTGIASPGAFQTTYHNKYYTTCFIAKFTNSGSRLWSTYFGGSPTGNHGYYGSYGSSIATDPLGNVVITGYLSDSDLTTPGAFESKPAAGFIARFFPTGARDWCTYFGYNSEIEIRAIITDGSGNIFIGGSTDDTSSTLSTSGAFQTKNAWGSAFLAKFSPSGSRLWCTYFGTKWSWCIIESLSTDLRGNVFLTGLTDSGTGLASPGAYQGVYAGGNRDAFVAKFSGGGARLWSTYFGGEGTDDGYSISVDAFGNACITGITTSATRIATPGAYQEKITNQSLESGYIAKFSGSGRLLWSTYFDAGGFGVAADNFGNIFMTGWCYGINGLATKGAFQETYGTTFIVKFNFNAMNDAGIYNVPPDTVCVGEHPVKVTIRNYGKNALDSVYIGWKINNKYQIPIRWSGHLLPDSSMTILLGVYDFYTGVNNINAWTYNPNGVKDTVPENDTARLVILSELPNAAWITKTIGSGTQYFSAIDSSYPQMNYRWTFDGNESGTGNPTTHKYTANGKSLVTLMVTDKHGCRNTYDSTIDAISQLDVSIFPNPFAIQTTIFLKLPDPALVKIYVSDEIGRYICTLFEGAREAGEFTTTFNAELYKTRPGMYFVNIMANDKFISRKMIQVDSDGY
jgi:hypothetical protein